jgi:hypothetical protein
MPVRTVHLLVRTLFLSSAACASVLASLTLFAFAVAGRGWQWGRVTPRPC